MTHPLRKAHSFLAGLTGWRRWLVALVLGLTTAAAMAPYYALPFLVTGFVGLTWLLDGSSVRQRSGISAFWTAWWFAFGYFLLSLYWTAFSFMVHATSTANLILLGTLGFLGVAGLAGFVALFYGGAGWLAMRFWREDWHRVLTLAVLWSATEYVRGHVFSGMPWNLTGQALAGMPVAAQIVSLIGTYGLGFLVILTAALPAALLRRDGTGAGFAPLAGSAAIAVVILGFGAIRLAGAELTYVDNVRVQIVQPAIIQQDKINPDRFVDNFVGQLELTGGPAATHGLGPNGTLYVIWPENAAYQFLERDPEARRMLGEKLPEGAVMMTGAVRVERGEADDIRYFNSFHVIADRPLPGDGDAEIDEMEEAGDWQIATSYDKHHLAPFGEYVPLEWLFEAIGVGRVLPLGSFTAGEGPATIDIGHTRVSPIICYETIFPGEIYPRGERPDWLVTVTNDAWFGDSAGPRQHLDMARLRAIESGLPMARSANTGISAMIDPWGRLVATLPLYERGSIEAPLPRALAPTFFHFAGDLIYFIFLAMSALWVITSCNKGVRDNLQP